MILSAATIRDLKLIKPFFERGVKGGRSHGLSVAGYDIAIAQSVMLGFRKRERFKLASSLEMFNMPLNVVGMVKDKSSWARNGLSVFNTVIEPGWRGYLTLELANHSGDYIYIESGDPIAQVVFMYTDKPTEGYGDGKYQDQEPGPQQARSE